ncbi:nucleotidyltransferase [Mobilitalea sibirica]|uniref:tRNA(Met) cytidine acetate ligase n=1 Tax=Mobilitalea sibirica TaxID=1462919 RepID=A0A8J7KVZ0_9FIRM|nr:nucleotidyltransferase [Mobilitalea sibirica]MBH1939717.1 nucleotidyltransferase [Mobilitalea sibirica]
MKVVGLITEYNPFHNGHKYHIDEARRITGADYVVIVMSGNFVQRGAPAMIDKYSRAVMALENGADIVLEIPVCYATGSAEYFALGTVSLLNKLGIIDYLCFGSESGDISILKEAAQFLTNVPASFDQQLTSYLKQGLSYPAARAKVVGDYFRKTQTHDNHDSKIADILSEPNNILGIEYLKALHKLSSDIIPVTIQRKSAHYHALDLTEQTPSNVVAEALFSLDVTTAGNPTISSATAIRRAILNADNVFGLSKLRNSVPNSVFQLLTNNYYKTYPVTEEDFSEIIKYKLLSEDKTSLVSYVDVSTDLADRMMNLKDLNKCISEIVKDLKTKNMTHTRIMRALTHMILNIDQETFYSYNQSGYTAYARVLGMKRDSSHLLREIKRREGIPVITKVTDAKKQLDPLGMQMLKNDIFATHIYNQTVYKKFGTTIMNEYKYGICII